MLKYLKQFFHTNFSDHFISQRVYVCVCVCERERETERCVSECESVSISKTKALLASVKANFLFDTKKCRTSVQIQSVSLAVMA